MDCFSNQDMQGKANSDDGVIWIVESDSNDLCIDATGPSNSRAENDALASGEAPENVCNKTEPCNSQLAGNDALGCAESPVNDCNKTGQISCQLCSASWNSDTALYHHMSASHNISVKLNYVKTNEGKMVITFNVQKKSDINSSSLYSCIVDSASACISSKINTLKGRSDDTGIFECAVCSFRAPTKISLLKHIKTQKITDSHQKSKLPCFDHRDLWEKNRLKYMSSDQCEFSIVQENNFDSLKKECRGNLPCEVGRTKTSLKNKKARTVNYCNSKARLLCRICSYACTSKGELKKHLFHIHNEKYYSCSKCSFTAGSLTAIWLHCDEEHGDFNDKVEIVCYRCKEIIKGATSFNEHVKKVHMKALECHLCHHTSTGLIELQFHLVKNHHKIVTKSLNCFECLYCSMKFSNLYKLKLHLVGSHIMVSRYNCKSCYYSLNDMTAFVFHRILFHSVDFSYRKCPVCGLVAPSVEDLIYHVKENHPGEKVKNYFDCKRVKDPLESQVCHRYSKHAYELDHCSVCLSFLKMYEQLKGEFHGKGQLNVCPFCRFGSTYVEELFAHVSESHLFPRMKKCSFCNFESPLIEELKNHLVVYHTHLSYYCEFCSSIMEKIIVHIKEDHYDSLLYKCVHCNCTCSIFPELVRHIKKCHVSKIVYECQHCSSSFDAISKLIYHMRANHSVRKCPMCTFAVSDIGILIEHLDDSHYCKTNKNNGMNCFSCGISSLIIKEFQSHIEEIHLNGNKVAVLSEGDCTDCEAFSCLIQGLFTWATLAHLNKISDESNKCTSKDSVIEKLRSLGKTTESEEFVCPNCSFRSDSIVKVVKHYRSEHKVSSRVSNILDASIIKNIGCPYCAYTFPSLEELKFHVLNTHIKKAFHCLKSCNFTCYVLDELIMHLNDSHKFDEQFQCPLCEVIVPSETMTIHMQSDHQQEYQCGYCEFSSINFDDFISHLNSVHDYIFLYRCVICEASFSKQQHLTTHVKEKHCRKSKLYRCNDCNATYPFLHELSAHIKAYHSPSKFNKCPKCNFTTLKINNLKRHVKQIHMVRPLSCCLCNFQVAYDFKLMIHLRDKHEIQDPFFCNLCGFCCQSLKKLKNHFLEKHSRNGNISCHKCSFSAQKILIVIRHVRNRHPSSVINYSDLSVNKESIKNDEKGINCTYCDFTCYSPIDLTNHINLWHAQKFKCSYCTFLSDIQYDYDNHIQICQNNKKQVKLKPKTEDSVDKKVCGNMNHTENKADVINQLDKIQTFDDESNKLFPPTLVDVDSRNSGYVHCCLCKSSYKTLADLSNHTSQNHNNAGLQNLFVCKFSLPLINKIQCYLSKFFQSTKTYDCHYCHNIFDSVNQLGNHIFQKHLKAILKEGKLLCWKCSFFSLKFSDLISHFELNHSFDIDCKCAFCEIHMANTDSLLNHLNNDHSNGKVFGCVNCPAEFSETEQLYMHFSETHLHNVHCSHHEFLEGIMSSFIAHINTKPKISSVICPNFHCSQCCQFAFLFIKITNKGTYKSVPSLEVDIKYLKTSLPKKPQSSECNKEFSLCVLDNAEGEVEINEGIKEEWKLSSKLPGNIKGEKSIAEMTCPVCSTIFTSANTLIQHFCVTHWKGLESNISIGSVVKPENLKKNHSLNSYTFRMLEYHLYSDHQFKGTHSLCQLCHSYAVILTLFLENSLYKCPECEFNGCSMKTVINHFDLNHIYDKSTSMQSVVVKQFQVHTRTHASKSHDCNACNFYDNFFRNSNSILPESNSTETLMCDDCLELSQQIICHLNKQFKPIEKGCFVCNVVIDHSHLSSHLKDEHDVIDNYRCPFCPVFIGGNHKYWYCCTTNNDCIPCSNIFQKYLQHIQLTHKDTRVLKCFQCNYYTFTPENLKKHLQTHGHELLVSYTCSECSYSTDFPEMLQNHILEHKNSQPENCPRCKCSFKKKSLLRLHTKLIHQVKLVALRNLNDSEKGKENITSYDVFSCIECKFQTTSLDLLRDHSQLDHPDVLKCFCDKNFNSVEEFLKHQKIIQLLKCPECAMSFKSPESFADHLHIHNQYGFKCSICFCVYEGIDGFINHLGDAHSSEIILITKEMCCTVNKFLGSEPTTVVKTDFCCCYCNSVLNDCDDFNQHVSCHKINFPDVFVRCKFLYGFFHDVEKYVVEILKNSKLFKCPYCSETNSELDQLANHMNEKHADSGKFSCYACNYFCFSVDNLVSHIVSTHSFNEVYKCRYCAFDVPEVELLVTHMNETHSNLLYKCFCCNLLLTCEEIFNHFTSKHYWYEFCIHYELVKSLILAFLRHPKTKVCPSLNCQFCYFFVNIMKKYKCFSLKPDIVIENFEVPCSFLHLDKRFNNGQNMDIEINKNATIKSNPSTEFICNDKTVKDFPEVSEVPGKIQNLKQEVICESLPSNVNFNKPEIPVVASPVFGELQSIKPPFESTHPHTNLIVNRMVLPSASQVSGDSLNKDLAQRLKGDCELRCSICSAIFLSLNFLIIHLLEYHKRELMNALDGLQTCIEKSYSCPLCGISILGIRNFKTHFNQHNSRKSSTNYLKCRRCGLTFLSLDELMTHDVLSCHIYLKKKDASHVLKCSCCDFCCDNFQDLSNHVHGEHYYDCPQCEYHFSDFMDFLLHFETHKNITFYKCPLCGLEKSDSTLIDHIKNEHASLNSSSSNNKKCGPYKCAKCEFSCASSANFSAHYKMEHSDAQKYKCKQCRFAMKDVDKLIEHIEESHTSQFDCLFCQFHCPSFNDFLYHLNKNHNRDHKLYFCPSCQFITLIPDEVSIHVKEMHPDIGIYTCFLCEYQEPRLYDIMDHITKIHHQKSTDVFQCSHCQYMLKSSNDFIEHFIHAHTFATSSTYVSYITKRLHQFILNDKASYKALENSYYYMLGTIMKHYLSFETTGGPPFKCLLCGEMASQLLHHVSASHLITTFSVTCTHCKVITQSFMGNILSCIEAHAKSIIYECHYTDFRSSSLAALFYHFDESHPDSVKEVCKNCSEMTCSFVKHIKKHHFNKVFKCSVCDYSTLKQDNLTAHYKDCHSFSCKKCNFTHENSLGILEHFKIKHELKKCNLCSFTTFNYDIFKDHMFSLHSIKKPVFCDKCDFQCARIAHLMEHIRKKHLKVKSKHCTSSSNSLKKGFGKDCEAKNPKFAMCSYCKTKFRSFLALTDHIEKNHKDVNLLTCSSCSFNCSTFKDFINHMRENHENATSHVCRHCGLNIASLNSFIGHMQNCHAPKYSCLFCNISFTSKGDLENHTKNCEKVNDVHKCRDCDFFCTSNKILESHWYDSHKKKSPARLFLKETETADKVCAKPKDIRGSMEGEEVVSNGGNVKDNRVGRNAVMDLSKIKFECLLCDEINVSFVGINEHVQKSHSKNGIWSCSKCTQIYDHSKRLSEHFALEHFYDYPLFKCNLCTFKTHHSTSLTAHFTSICHPELFKQYNERFGCPLCSWQAPGIKKLTQHLNKIHVPKLVFVSPEYYLSLVQFVVSDILSLSLPNIKLPTICLKKIGVDGFNKHEASKNGRLDISNATNQNSFDGELSRKERKVVTKGTEESFDRFNTRNDKDSGILKTQERGILVDHSRKRKNAVLKEDLKVIDKSDLLDSEVPVDVKESSIMQCVVSGETEMVCNINKTDSVGKDTNDVYVPPTKRKKDKQLRQGNTQHSSLLALPAIEKENKDSNFVPDKTVKQSANYQAKKSSVQKKKNIYECNKCSFVSYHKFRLEKHVIRAHAKNIKCLDCTFSCKYEEEIANHMNESHVNIYRCYFCEVDYFDIEIFNLHMKKKHPSVLVYSCPRCPFSTTVSEKIIDHFNEVHKHFVFKFCPLCTYTTIDSTVLLIHLRENHGLSKPTKSLMCASKKKNKLMKNDSYRCVKCKHLYFSVENFFQHMSETHANVSPLGVRMRVEIRKLTMLDESGASSIVGSVSNTATAESGLFNCPRCSFSSSDLSHLRTHMRICKSSTSNMAIED